MALTEGTRLGVYEVVGLIGQGGMGEVYQARDTTLDRDVALKVLPEAFTSDPDRLARFEREAKVLASLNHPNIGSIYGLEEAEGVKALVLELVEGPTLADRIKQGPIPLDEALPIAKQIAEALEAAHEQGVIHRDLKPANVKVKDDGTVKVLDFGLAKAFQPDAGDPGMSMSPTISLTAAATQMGMVIGTAAYMAPEQASGKTVDKRADVWAFGVVLYEMLTGTRPFVGDDVSKTLARVIDREPDWTALPADLPPVLGHFLRGCLQKSPRHRIRDIGDVRLAMAGAFETTVAAQSDTLVATPLHFWQRSVPAVGILVTALLVMGLAVWGLTRPDAVPADVVRFVIPSPDAAPFDFSGLYRDLAISADGTQVIYQARAPGGGLQLTLRPIDELGGAPLRGTEGGVAPFFSPDGEWVGFLSDAAGTTLQKVSIFGGPPVTLTEFNRIITGASWGTDDQIIFGSLDGGLFRVPGGGGEPDVLTSPDADEGERRHYHPSVIPGRQAVLFVIGIGDASAARQLAVLALDTGEVTRLGLAGTQPQYASTGHLVYSVGDGSVRAAPFDVERLEVTGNPVPILDGVVVNSTSGFANFSIAANGRLVYASGAGSVGERSLVWVDREGREEPLAAEPGSYTTPRVSPDGTRVAVDRRQGNNQDVWVYSIERRTLTRVTTDPAVDSHPLWTLNGERLVFQSAREGARGLFWKAADGTGTTDRLMESASPTFVGPSGWSPEGDSLVFGELLTSAANYDIGVLSMEGDRPSEPLLQTGFAEKAPTVSPDGHWLAYFTNETGQDEVYVQRFPDLGEKQQISVGGGREPLWSPDGRELFFRSPNGLMAVPVLDTEPTFRAGSAESLFEQQYATFIERRNYDIAADGQRFLMIKETAASDGATAQQLVVVLNWFEELKERVPVN